MKIKPLKGIVHLKIDEVTAGALNTSMRPSAVEVAEVSEVGEGVTSVKKGDKIFVKAWAVDNIVYNDQKFYFVAIETNGILAVIK